ncbi:MAG: hypothetical protein N2322_07660, partial [Terrimicrobiaceae bacterium]|nr:hypothetical protein [Terrimicrobiaceae bacterium]
MLILRADAGLAMGTGHVMRMLALGQAWLDQGGEACLAYSECPANLLLRLKNEGIMDFRIPHPPGSPRDCESVCQLARGYCRPALVVDGYHFSGEYMAGLASSGVDHALLDDMGFTSGSEALLVINPNLAASAALYPGLSPGKLLAGPHYALLRREFRNAGRGDSDGPARRLLVTFGGSDPGNYSARVLREVCGLVAECQVVCGAANPHIAELRELARGAAAACRVEIREDVAD